MINRKQNLIKYGIMGIGESVSLFILCALIIIVGVLKIYTSTYENSDLNSIFVKNIFNIIQIVLGLISFINVTKTLKHRINNFLLVLKFFNENEYYNQSVATCIVNKFIEIVGNYIIIISNPPYIIGMSECLNPKIVEKESKLFSQYKNYIFEFTNMDGQLMQIYLPNISKKDGSFQMLSGYLNKIV